MFSNLRRNIKKSIVFLGLTTIIASQTSADLQEDLRKLGLTENDCRYTKIGKREVLRCVKFFGKQKRMGEEFYTRSVSYTSETGIGSTSMVMDAVLSEFLHVPYRVDITTIYDGKRGEMDGIPDGSLKTKVVGLKEMWKMRGRDEEEILDENLFRSPENIGNVGEKETKLYRGIIDKLREMTNKTKDL